MTRSRLTPFCCVARCRTFCPARLRVVLLRLASRLQTLRWYAAPKRPCPQDAGAESQQVFRAAGQPAGHLADQVGAGGPGVPLSCSPPTTAAWRASWTRSAPSARTGVEAARVPAGHAAGGAGWRPRCRAGPSTSTASGRRCRASSWRSTRCSTCARCASSSTTCRPAMPRWRACTRAGRPVAGRVRRLHRPAQAQRLPVLHTVVRDDGRPWRCRSARASHARARRIRRGRALGLQGGRRKGYAGVSAGGDFEEACGRGAQGRAAPAAGLGARLGRAGRRGSAAHRRPRRRSTTASTSSRRRPRSSSCRGRHAGRLRLHPAHRPGPPLPRRRVDGAMVPLNTAEHGQTVEIVAAKEGGPSLDWLNPSWATCAASARGPRCGPGSTPRRWPDHRARPRAGGKAAAARRPHRAQARHLAAQLGFKGADALFEVVGKDEFSLRNIEQLLRPPSRARRRRAADPQALAQRSGRRRRAGGGAWAR
jgi:GTP pyrophosphokinase